MTQIITNKEKKSSSYKEGRLEKLSDEKVAKIKKFAKEYIPKILRKLEKPGKAPRRSPSTVSPVSSSTLQHVLQSHEGADDEDVAMGDPTFEDMSIVSDSDGDEDKEDGQEYLSVRDEDMNIPRAVVHTGKLDDPPTAETRSQMKLDEGTAHPIGVQLPSDPRRRPPNEDAWEPPQGSSSI